jgi:hypothetical protein
MNEQGCFVDQAALPMQRRTKALAAKRGSGGMLLDDRPVIWTDNKGGDMFENEIAAGYDYEDLSMGYDDAPRRPLSAEAKAYLERLRQERQERREHKGDALEIGSGGVRG